MSKILDNVFAYAALLLGIMLLISAVATQHYYYKMRESAGEISLLKQQAKVFEKQRLYDTEAFNLLQKDLQTMKGENKKYEQALQQIYASSEESKNYGTCVIPDDILQLLRDVVQPTAQ